MAAAPGFLDSLSPWASRSNTPKSGQRPGGDKTLSGTLGKQQGGDHRVNHRHRLSLKEYPDDCPPLVVRWFYAVDVPKRKPFSLDKPTPDKPAKVLPAPKKFAPFSARDSRSIETSFQKLAEQQDVLHGNHAAGDISDAKHKDSHSNGSTGSKENTSLDDSPGSERRDLAKVPVNEDFLFDVDIDKRELAPTYWLGPVYDVRRATWFYQDSASKRPCDENLAAQLEEGYVKAKPWRNKIPVPSRSASQSGHRSTSVKPGEEVGMLGATNIKPPRKASIDEGTAMNQENTIPATSQPKFQLQTHRLFGAYMNSVVTYQDANTAWLLTDDFLSRMSSSVYQRFAGGGHLGGVKVVRGFTSEASIKETKVATLLPEQQGSEERGRSSESMKRRSAPPRTTASMDHTMSIDVNKAQRPEVVEPESKSKQSVLERRMATIIGSPGVEDPAIQEEEARKREENEIQDDYKNAEGEDQEREIEHLLLVTHGIGQRLGLRMESLNFIHDVNVLRKTLKNVYDNSLDLQALNSEVDKLPKNCRIQVLPVVWRHLLDFPKQRVKRQKAEQDIGDIDDFADDMDYPQLSDINVEGVPAIRNLVEDLFLDILLYQSNYGELIAGIVQKECNRVYRLFTDRNPSFKGKVSLVGHSMGSLVMFDLLCRQKDAKQNSQRHVGKHAKKRSIKVKPQEDSRTLNLDFDVEDFYCLGSPVGLFQMIQGRTIAGRRALPASAETQDSLKEGFLNTSTSTGVEEDVSTSIEVSSPKVGQMFNIFHPCDPISYRVEPLISPVMKTLKPQPLPYIKKSMFGIPGQGLTGIGARVGQSVSGLWSNITTGVASSLLNRSLGLVHDSQFTPTQTRAPLSMSAGANINGGTISSPEALEEEKKKAVNSAAGNGEEVEHPPTLIDSEIETLYSGFQKRRKTHTSDESWDLRESAEWQEAEDRAKRLRREEAKVRALNCNGRVDFSIQEGVFDISLIASLASHLSYWADEDVSHFMISQLLSRQRVVQREKF